MKPDHGATFSLYSSNGNRKYLNSHERSRTLAAAASLPLDQALFTLTLAWTGARVSEVLALTASSFQVECGTVAIRTLKRRRPLVREVPIPPALMQALNRHFSLSTGRDTRLLDDRLWPWHRVTAWRVVKRIMLVCGITGCRASPRGFRHAFGVRALHSHVPLSVLQLWLGHARISTTAIYAAVSGPDQLVFAKALWAES